MNTDFKTRRATRELVNLAESKMPEDLIKLADLSISNDEDNETDLFVEGIKIGLLMEEKKCYQGISFSLFDEDDRLELFFVGTRDEVEAKLKSLKDWDEAP